MVNITRIEATPAESFTIFNAPGLDPITVVTQDIAQGCGRIIVECFGDAWSAYFGAMYTDKVGDFLASVSTDYLASKLWPSSQRRTKRGEQYLSRIAAAVIEALIKQRNGSSKNVEAGLENVVRSLTFNEFRTANVARCLKWHPHGIESWSPSDWLTAVTGELGELASLVKMRNRERDGLPGNKFSPTDKQIADELADVLTYLDLLAAALGVDLGRAAVEKFNEVSKRVGFPDRIEMEIRV